MFVFVQEKAMVYVHTSQSRCGAKRSDSYPQRLNIRTASLPCPLTNCHHLCLLLLNLYCQFLVKCRNIILEIGVNRCQRNRRHHSEYRSFVDGIHRPHPETEADRIPTQGTAAASIPQDRCRWHRATLGLTLADEYRDAMTLGQEAAAASLGEVPI
jgi:hypothetical protein